MEFYGIFGNFVGFLRKFEDKNERVLYHFLHQHYKLIY